MKDKNLHSYEVKVNCRQRGAIGIFENKLFHVMSKNAAQAHNDAFDLAQKQGYEVNGVVRVTLIGE